MEYTKFKNADRIVNSSRYIVKNPNANKNHWNKVFGNNNPIDLELGTGRGEFIINMAKTNPKRNFVGLELSTDQLVKAVEKMEHMNLPNLRLINGNADDITDMFGREIDTIYLTFSEPWPKKIDEKKRFTHPNYLKLYDRVFKKKKHIIMKTDNKILFAYSLESLSNYWYVFNKVSLDLKNDERNIKNIETDWEIKCNKDGKPIYYVDAIFED